MTQRFLHTYMNMADDSQQKGLSKTTTEEFATFRHHRIKGAPFNITDRDSQMKIIKSKIDIVLSNDPDQQPIAISVLKYMLNIMPDPPFKLVMEASVVARLVEFITQNDLPELQSAVVKFLAFSASKLEHIKVIVEHDVVPQLVKFLMHAPPDQYVRAAALLTLGFIARDSPEHRVCVLENKALEPLLAQFEEDINAYLLHISTWTLIQFCKGIPPLNSEMTSKVVPVLRQLMHSSKKEVMAYVCWTLDCFPYGEFQDDFKPDVCRNLVDMLSHPSPQVIIPALVILAKIAKHDETVTRYIVADLKVARQLKQVLAGEYDEDTKKAALRTVTYITKINCNHTQEVVSEGIINVLANLFTSSEDDFVKKEVAWAISNVTCNATPQALKSVSETCIKPMCDMLDCSDLELVFNCISGLHRILNIWQQALIDRISSDDDVFHYTEMIEDFEGLEKIVKLRDHGQDFVSGIAKSILHNYWIDISLREEAA